MSVSKLEDPSVLDRQSRRKDKKKERKVAQQMEKEEKKGNK